MTMQALPDRMKVLDEFQLTAGVTVLNLIDSITITGWKMVLIRIGSESNVLMSFASGSVAATDGTLYRAYEQFLITTETEAANCQYIRAASTDVTLYVQVYGDS